MKNTPMIRLKHWLAISALIVCGLSVGVRPAQADCDIGACLGVGAELASIDSSDGPLLNLLTQLLLGSSVSVNVLNWEGVAQTDVNLLGLVNAIKVQANVASTEAALQSSISLLDLIGAMVTALENEGDLAGAAILEALEADLLAIPDMNGTLALGGLIELTDSREALLDIDINAFHLLFGSLQLFNSSNTLDTPGPITVSTAPLLSALGLGSLASSVQVSLRITEPPVFRCGPNGVTVQSANVRLKLDLSLLSGFDINTSLVITPVDVSLTQLSVYLELAPATATLTGVTPTGVGTGSVTASATHGIARLFLGQFVDATFFNPAFSLPANSSIYSDLAAAEIGSLSILTSTATVSIRSYAEGSQNTAGLLFSVFPSQQTVDSSVGVIGSLISEAMDNLELTVSGGGLLSVLSLIGSTLNDLLDVILAPLIIILDGQLLSPILTTTVDNLLGSLGISIGKATVFVGGFAADCSISGRVFEDNNPADGVADAAENWNQGVPVWIHAIQAGQLVASDKVVAGDGSFTLSGLPQGTYTFILADAPGLTVVSIPEGWQEALPIPASYTVELLIGAVADINFGLLRLQLLISGAVFYDIGSGAGIANDGLQNGGEADAAGVAVQLIDVSGGEVIGRAESDASGGFSFNVADSWQNQPLALQLASLENRILIDIAAGTSGGSYEDVDKRLLFTPVAGAVSGLSVALVPVSRLLADVEVVSGAGKTVLLGHRFQPGSAGNLTLAMTADNSPPAGWNAVVYRDSDCDGELIATETVIDGAQPLTAGAEFCVLVKVFIAASATEGASVSWQLSASYQLNGSITEQLLNRDVVSVSQRYQGFLELVKSVDKSSAKPGEVLSYVIVYRNNGNQPLSNLQVFDATPAFTVFLSTDCNSNLGGGISSCTATVPAASSPGEMNWNFNGELQAGASGSVEFQVTIDATP
jgi:uncharacterized repeat protein (TIGR01451 family)